MQIGGFQRFSLIDYPGKVAAVVFTQGCNFRCPYCHNAKLVIPSKFRKPLHEEGIIDFLFRRKNKLQGVVVTGGEPTLQKDLINFLSKIKQLGYCIKLDTNGTAPRVLKKIISKKLVDFIAMDVKAPLERYSQAAGIAVDTDLIRESIDLILHSSMDHMFRTTVVKPLLSGDDIAKISVSIKDAKHFVLQNFVIQEDILDKVLLDRGHYTHEEFYGLQKKWERGTKNKESKEFEDCSLVAS